MKVMTVLGTRPEIIRLSRIIPRLDEFSDHILVHTGQNYDPNLNEIFFRDLEVRAPDYYLGITDTSTGSQIGGIIASIEKIIKNERPDRLLILGDTNSCLSAIVAKRLGIPVFHLEAGNRCFDDRVPEEVNRRIIDHCSDILMPYTERSRANLLREGIKSDAIFVIGNPILEVIQYYQSKINASNIREELGVNAEEYFLVTMHRAENVDDESRLLSLLESLECIHQEYQQPIICSLHPRTRDRLKKLGKNLEDTPVTFLPPLGFFDFVNLEQNARCVISDSGTVQEECSIFRIPNITIRDVTERPETIECGSNIICGTTPETILRSLHLVLAQEPRWQPPKEYLTENVSDIATRICLGLYRGS